MARGMRRALHSALVLMLAVLGAQFFGIAGGVGAAVASTPVLTSTAPSAGAPTPALVGAAECAADGSYRVSWTLEDREPRVETATVTGVAPTTLTVAPNEATLDPGAHSVFRATVPGSAPAAALTVRQAWTGGGDRSISSTVTLGEACGAATPPHAVVAVPADPTVVQSQCLGTPPTASAPSITTASTPGVTYTISPASGWQPGTWATVTATAAAGREFLRVATPSGWRYVSPSSETFAVALTPAPLCAGSVSPVAPTVTQPACQAAGSAGGPALALPTTQGVSYRVSAAPPYRANQHVVVTATATGGRHFARPAPAGWTYVDRTHETYGVLFGATPGCVDAVGPTAQQSRCRSDGQASSPRLIWHRTRHVRYLTTPAAPYIAGQTIVVSAVAGDGTQFHTSLPSGWTYVDAHHATTTIVLDAAPNCVLAVAPTFTDPHCTGPDSFSRPAYRIALTPGVHYAVNGQPTKAGRHYAALGAQLTVTARAASGFTLANSYRYSHAYPATIRCQQAVVATAPTFHEDACSTTTGLPIGATFTIPTSSGVAYSVNGRRLAPGSNPATDGTTVTVVASGAAGYTLSGTTRWSHTYNPVPVCSGTGGVQAGSGRGGTTIGGSGGRTTVPVRGIVAGSTAGGSPALAFTGIYTRALILGGVALLLLGTAALACAAPRRVRSR